MANSIEYMRQWRAENQDKMRAYRAKHYRLMRKKPPLTGCGRIISEEAKRRGPNLGSERTSVVRYDPLVNWGFSKGKCKLAGASFMGCHQ